MTIPKKFTRTFPFLKVLQNAKVGVNKVELLKKFPPHVVNDIVELLYNVLVGNIPIKRTDKSKLVKHRRILNKFANLPTLRRHTHHVYKQKGGFLSSIIPIIVSIVGQLFH